MKGVMREEEVLLLDQRIVIPTVIRMIKDDP
jgi:hypothetical protein